MFSKQTESQACRCLKCWLHGCPVGELSKEIKVKKLILLFCIGLLFIGCKKTQKEINSSNNNIIISDSTERILIKGNNNTISAESFSDNNNDVNFLLPYLGTYLPEIYLSGLIKYKSHTKASEEFREFDEDNPNVLFINEKCVEGIYNFHEGTSVNIFQIYEDSIKVKTSKGKEVYKLEDNQYVIIGETKYKKINDAKKINEEVISSFLANTLMPHNELTNENSSLKISENKIYYNEQEYVYGTGLVGMSPKYDFIIKKEKYESKFIEILDHTINIYNAYSPDGNYDMGWMTDAVYEIENSFEY